MQDASALILIIVFLAGTAGVIVYFLTNQIKSLKQDLKGDENQVLMQWLKEMRVSVEKNSEVMEKQLHNQRSSIEEQLREQRDLTSKQTKLIWERLTEAQTVIGNIHKQIGGIEEFGKDIKDLSNILKSPKLRGGFGEQLLNEVLANALPKELYKIQYEFKNGVKCDAAIITQRGIIPIDSKFSMENFKAMSMSENEEARGKFKKEFVKDVKNRIDEISQKYIKPDEGTTEYAIMYIPSESIFYEIIMNNSEIEGYARSKKVGIASPNTFFSYLNIILTAHRQYELQQHADEILKALAGVKTEAVKFDEDLGVLEKHISNASKASENVRSKFGKLFTKIENINEIGKEEDSKLLE